MPVGKAHDLLALHINTNCVFLLTSIVLFAVFRIPDSVEAPDRFSLKQVFLKITLSLPYAKERQHLIRMKNINIINIMMENCFIGNVTATNITALPKLRFDQPDFKWNSQIQSLLTKSRNDLLCQRYRIVDETCREFFNGFSVETQVKRLPKLIKGFNLFLLSMKKIVFTIFVLMGYIFETTVFCICNMGYENSDLSMNENSNFAGYNLL